MYYNFTGMYNNFVFDHIKQTNMKKVTSKRQKIQYKAALEMISASQNSVCHKLDYHLKL